MAYYIQQGTGFFHREHGQWQGTPGPRGPESASSGGPCAAQAGRCQALPGTRSPVRSTERRELRRCPTPGTAEAAGPRTRCVCRGAVLAVRPPDGSNRGNRARGCRALFLTPRLAGSAAARGVPAPLTRRPAARQLLLSAVTAAILPRAERPRTHPRHSQPAAAAPLQPTSSGRGPHTPTGGPESVPRAGAPHRRSGWRCGACGFPGPQ